MPNEEPVSVDGILDVAIEAGMIVLQNGGETYRTEETMGSMARSLGATSAQAFVTPTVVMLTCTGKDGLSRTRIERIRERSINLGKIASVNEISRRLAGHGRRKLVGAGVATSLLRRVVSSRNYGPVSVTVATGLAAFFFSLLFAGSPRESVVAFALGVLLRLALSLFQPLGLSAFIVSVFGGFVVALLSRLAVLVGIASTSGNVSSAVLMILVPGIAIVNAIRDIIAGDLMAGSARLLEAFVTAAALSIGAAFGLLLFPAEASIASTSVYLEDASAAFICSFCATAAFAWFFQINRYDIFWSSLFGAIGWSVYLAANRYFASPMTGYLIGALFVGFLSEAGAVILKKPATVYIVPGIIPLVPGGGMYETMFQAVWGNVDAASSTGFNTLTAAAAIAVGIALASSFARLAGKILRRASARGRHEYR